MPTIDRFDVAFDNATDAPLLANYRDNISAIPGYFGMFRADDPNYVSADVNGNVLSLTNWTDSKHFVKSETVATPKRVYDAELGRSVLKFDKAAAQYLVSDVTFNFGNAHTFIVNMKVVGDMTAFQNIFGLASGPPESNNDGIWMRDGRLVMLANGAEQGFFAGSQFVGQWINVMFNNNGAGGVRLTVNDQAKYVESTDTNPTGTNLAIGSPFFPPSVYIDAIAVFTTDLTAAGQEANLDLVRNQYMRQARL